MLDVLWILLIGCAGFALYWIIAEHCYAVALSIELALFKAAARSRHGWVFTVYLWLYRRSVVLSRLAKRVRRPQIWMTKYRYLLTTSKRMRQDRVFRVWTHATPSPWTPTAQAAVTDSLREIAYACVAAEHSWHAAWDEMHQPAEPGSPAQVAAAIGYETWTTHFRWLRAYFTELSAAAEFFGYAVLGDVRDYLHLAGPPPDLARLIPS